MKKLFLLFIFVCIGILGYCQDVKVNINNQDAKVNEDCPYRINGICATEDIGGVDVSFIGSNIVLTNYNVFPVTVIWQIEYLCGDCRYDGEEKTATTVLGAEGQKQIYLSEYRTASKWSVKGLIVRKLAQ